jgi:hypothetical protein
VKGRKPPPDVVASIDGLIDALSKPLSEADKHAGWDERLRKGWRKHFICTRNEVLTGQWRGMERYHLMRWLNFDGIGLGPLADRVAAFQQTLRQHDTERPYEGTTGGATRRFLDELGIRRQRGRRSRRPDTSL